MKGVAEVGYSIWYVGVMDTMDILFSIIFVLRRSRTLDSQCYQKSVSHAGEVTTVTGTSHNH
jgi:hypothetical protein